MNNAMKTTVAVFAAAIGALGTTRHAMASARVETRGTIVATGVEMLGSVNGSSVVQWDTTKESDGWKTLTSGGVSVNVLILNEPSVVGGRLSANVTWDNSRVVVVRDNVIVPYGKTLTIDAGCVVKFTEGAQFVVENGGSLVANGACLTALDDDSVGGDTDMDGTAGAAAVGVEWWLDDVATAALAKVRFVDGATNLPTRSYSTGKPYGTLPSLSKRGATFAGWFTAPDGRGDKVSPSATIPNGDSTLYSYWKYSSLSVESGAATADATDAVGSIGVLADESWSAVCDADWVTVNIQGGEVSYSLSGNASTEARAATIRITTASGELRDITITQNGIEQVAAPVIDPVDGTEFDGSSRRVTISGASDGAEIRYTLDGSEPSATSKLYTKSFNVFDTTTVKARIFKSGIAASETASALIVRLQTLAESLDVPLWTVTTDGAKGWTVSQDVAHSGVSSARSGAIGNDQTSTLTTTVDGAGILTFWWKTDCEDDEDGDNWDYLKFEVDGNEVARIDGDSGWKQVSAKVKGDGRHTLIWTYVKDYTDDFGTLMQDCGWVDQVAWTALAGDSEVPVAWLENLGAVSAGVSAADAAALDADLDGLSAADEYIAGTDPNDSGSVFKTTIDMVDGKPVLSCVPDLLEERKYMLFGRKSLSDNEWQIVSEGEETEYRLFRFGVQMPDGTTDSDDVVFTVNEAGWKYLVAFDPNEGEGGGERMLEYGSVVSAPIAKRQGYGFLGWYTEATGGERVNDSTVVTGEVVYYAHWLPANTIAIETDDTYKTEPDGTFMLNLRDLTIAASEPKLSVKGLPPGLKYDANTMTISGRATKPGTYTVTMSATNANVKKPVTETFDIVVPNLRNDLLPGLEQGEESYGTLMCGSALPMDLIDCSPAEEGWTVKVTGLPAGLKFTAKDIMKKGSKTEVEILANTVYGVPTKAGTFTVTFTASKKGEPDQVATITLNVEALPTWAQGTFTGYVRYDGEGDGATSIGYATMTAASNGKVSGKIALDGTNWTFSATSFSRTEYVKLEGDVVETNLVVEAVATSGKATMPVELALRPSGCDMELINAAVEGTFGDGEVKLWRGMWKDKASAALAKTAAESFSGAYTAILSPQVGSGHGSGYLLLTAGKDGSVKATGKLADGTGVTASSPIMYDPDAGWFAIFYSAPSAYKGGSFAAAVGFEAFDGSEAAVSESPYRLVPVMFAPMWTSRNPQATGAYGKGFERELSLLGAHYDKAAKLSAWCGSLQLWLESAPELGFAFKRTYVDGSGRKVSSTEQMWAMAANTLWQPGLTATVNEKGAISVMKATKPVQDRETKEWSYGGDNDGAFTLSFAQATGIVKGTYTFWYDYVSAQDDTSGKATMVHTSKKVSFEGVLVQGEDPQVEGYYLWDEPGEYVDEKTGKPKAYKYKLSLPVRFLAE